MSSLSIKSTNGPNIRYDKFTDPCIMCGKPFVGKEKDEEEMHSFYDVEGVMISFIYHWSCLSKRKREIGITSSQDAFTQIKIPILEAKYLEIKKMEE